MSSPASNQQVNNLLSPNAALEQVTTSGQQQQQQHHQQRRKSTLSGNGFFIDYSCTRRRSSAAVRQPQQYSGGGGGYASPGLVTKRLGGGSFCAGSQPSSPRSRAQSRSGATSLSPMEQRRLTCSSMLLVPPLYAPSALAGSRKTSIFDPAGHSLGAAHLRAMRRKSTMVTSMPAFEMAMPAAATDLDPSSSSKAKMLSLAKAAALEATKNGPGGSGASSGSGFGRSSRRSQLVRDHVPVIGCSPTSIGASLAALDETRRYEKLLKTLKRHEKSRLKRDKKRLKQRQKEQEPLTGSAAAAQQQANSMSFRRKSLRAIKDAAALLGPNSGKQKRAKALLDTTIEDLSVSSMSLSHAFDQTSATGDDDDDESNLRQNSRSNSSSSWSSSSIACCSSLGDFNKDDNNNFNDNDQNDDDHDDYEDDDDDERYELNNDELFLDDDTLVNFNEPLPPGGQSGQQVASGESAEGGQRTKSADGKSSSLVKIAMRRLTGSMKASRTKKKPSTSFTSGPSSATALQTERELIGNTRKQKQQNADYWHYYYYLRENSIDAIDDLPINGGGGGGSSSANAIILSDTERRIRLHMNYSLARIEILNYCGQSSGAFKTSPCRESHHLATSAPALNSTGHAQEQVGQFVGDEHDENLFAASDVSLSLSTSSSCMQAAPISDTSLFASPGNGGSCSSSDNNLQNFASSPSLTSSSAAFSSKSSLNVRGGWQRQYSMSSQSVAAPESFPPPAQGLALDQEQQSARRGEPTSTTRHEGGSLADDECTSLECLMDRNRLSPNPMRPKSADTSAGRQHRSASGELPTPFGTLPATTTDTEAAATTTATATTAAAKQSRRSASFRGHTSSRRQQPAVVEPELDDFERFRRAHRAGYDQNGDAATVEAAVPQKRWPGGRGRNSQLHSSVRSARGSSSSNLARPNVNSSSRVMARAPVASPAGRTSVSWDTLASAWPNDEDGGYMAGQKPAIGQHQQQQQRAPVAAVKRTSSARLSSRKHEQPEIGSHSNPSRLSNNHHRATNLPVGDRQHHQPTTSSIGQDLLLSSSNQMGQPAMSTTSGGRTQSQASVRNWGPQLGDDGRSTWQVAHSQRGLVVVGDGPTILQQHRSSSLRVASSAAAACNHPSVAQQRWPNEAAAPRERPAVATAHGMDRKTLAEKTTTAGGQPANIATRLIRSNESGTRLEAPIAAHRVRAHSMGASSDAAAARQTEIEPSRRRSRRHNNDQFHDYLEAEKRPQRNHQQQHDEPPPGQQTNNTVHPRGEKEQQQVDEKYQLLAKNCFTCLVIGSRQTGKRTVVKCFVKLVNEFRLAADEYRKEKILTKLMDCSERLQVLAKKQAELEQQELERERHQSLMGGGTGNRRRSRVNSWLGGKLLTHLPAGSKLRLHSLVPTLATPILSSAQHQSSDQLEHQRQQRRHTAIEPAGGFNLCRGRTGPSGRASIGPAQFGIARDGIGRHSAKERRRPTETFLVPDNTSRLNCCNKSDFNINYLDTDDNNSGRPNQQAGGNIVMTQLQVPSIRGGPSNSFTLSASSLCEPTRDFVATGSSQPHLPTRICINTDDDDDDEEEDPKVNKRRRSSNNNLHHRRRRRRRRHHQTPRRRQTTVSLKEINRRRISVRFSTRRQLSDKYLELIAANNNNCYDSNGGENHNTPPQLPDSIMVVYSVNDRDSFEYARSLVSQLRSIKEKQKIPLPVIVVANKIDLERAKVVRPEEGRALAKRNGCKYMEISCTVGFKLDNLLVGLRTQLVLKHHTTLNSILRAGSSSARQQQQQQQQAGTSKDHYQRKDHVQELSSKFKSGGSAAASGNILVRFYKRYVMDDYGQDFDCDNFSKL